MSETVPIERTATTVTLAVADWEASLDRLDDAADREAIERSDADRARLGEAEVRRLSYTAPEVRRVTLDGVSPGGDLAQASLTSPSYLAEIEGGEKPGSAAAPGRIAVVLRVPMEHLVG